MQEATLVISDSAVRYVTVQSSHMESERGASAMDALCQQIANLTQAVQGLQDGYQRLEQQLESLSPSTSAHRTAPASSVSASTPTVVVPPPEPRVPAPERFMGDCSKFRAFRNACHLYFPLQPRTFSLESTKVGFIISLLQGEPQTWAHHLLEQDSFLDEIAKLYDDPQHTTTAEASLHALQQGHRPVEEYVTDFKR